MRRLINYFLRGLVVVVPIGVTVWVCLKIFHAIDDLLGFRIAGSGFVIMIALVTFVGFLASTIVARIIGDAFGGGVVAQAFTVLEELRVGLIAVLTFRVNLLPLLVVSVAGHVIL